VTHSSRRLTVSFIFLAVAAGVIYWPALTGGFIFDDEPLLTGSALVKAGDGLYRMWFTSQPIDYWPLTNSSFWLEWRLWGLQPVGYHVTNLLLHIASAVLVWAILRRLAVPGAFLAAALFLVHPVNVESVAWIAQRKNTLSMAFFLLSILWYLNGELGQSPASAAGAVEPGRSAKARAPSRRGKAPREKAGGGRWYWLSLAAFTAAMLSKASVAVLPAILLVLVWWKRGRIARADVLRTAPFFGVAVALTVVNFWFQAQHGAAVIRDVTPLQRALGAAAVTWFYFYKALAPIHLMFVYPQWQVRADELRWWLPAAAAVVMTAVLVWQRRRPAIRALLCAWAFFLIALVPVMGFTDVYFMRYALVADHYEYIALLAVVTVVAAGLAQLEHVWRRTLAIAGTAIFLLLASATWRQSHQYADAETLYARTLEANPGAWIIRNNLALLYLNGASPDVQKAFANLTTALATNPNEPELQNNVGTALFQMNRFGEAAEHHRDAARLNPLYAVAYANLGHDLEKLGQFGQAADAYRRALELDPEMSSARTGLGAALQALGRPAEAGQQLQRAAQSASPSAQDHTAMGDALQRLGRIDEAIAQYKETLKTDPSSMDTLRNLGHALITAGRFDEAEGYLRQAVALRPDNAAAHDNLGNALQQMRRLDEAVAELRIAVARGSGPELAAMHNDLGVALARQNHRDEAIEHFREALRIDPGLAAAQANLTRALAR
jgi:tetratricopeptide (TPR) repeat protein